MFPALALIFPTLVTKLQKLTPSLRDVIKLITVILIGLVLYAGYHIYSEYSNMVAARVENTRLLSEQKAIIQQQDNVIEEMRQQIDMLAQSNAKTLAALGELTAERQRAEQLLKARIDATNKSVSAIKQSTLPDDEKVRQISLTRMMGISQDYCQLFGDDKSACN